MDHCIEYLTLFLSCFGCLLLCVRISTPIVNYETSFLEISENSAILECSLERLHSRKSAGVWSILSRTLRIFWQEQLRRTLQNFPECLKVWCTQPSKRGHFFLKSISSGTSFRISQTLGRVIYEAK